MSKRFFESESGELAKRLKEDIVTEIPDPRCVDEISESEENADISIGEIEGVLPIEGSPEIPCNLQIGYGELQSETLGQRDTPAPLIEETILSSEDKHFDKFKTAKFQRNIKVKLNLTNYSGDTTAIADDLDSFYSRILTPILNKSDKFDEDDLYWVVVKSVVLKKHLFLAAKKISEFDPREFTDKVHSICQSIEDFVLKDMTFEIYLTKSGSGKGYHRKPSKGKAPLDLMENSNRKQSVITIKNKDQSCGLRALLVGLKWYTEKFDEIPNLAKSDRWNEWRKIRADNNAIHQTKLTEEFVEKANAWIHNEECEVGENCENIGCHNRHFFSMERPFGENSNDFLFMNCYLSQFNLNLGIIDASDKHHNIFLSAPENDTMKTIHLEWHPNPRHFNFIKDIRAYVEKAYYCRGCGLGHWSLNHKCEYTCYLCGCAPVCSGGEKVDCDACGRTFINQSCYENHSNYRNVGGSMCNDRKRCENCECVYNGATKKKHVCGEYTCKDCAKVYTENPHYCMLKTLDLEKLKKQDEKNKIIVSYDIESCISTDTDGKEIHKPMLLISETVCDKCWDQTEKRKIVRTESGVECDNDCISCGFGTKVWFGYDCVKEFADYLYTDLAKKAELLKSNVYVFAHNSKGYDGHFIMQDIFKRTFRDKPQIILQGLKVLKIGLNNVNFIDSLSFFQQPLSDLPKSFGFEHIIEKGFFPHKFNKEDNFNYVGQIPGIDEFGIEFMKDEKAEECRKWHSEFGYKSWNFITELKKYCKNDVRILTMAIMEFRALFQSVTELDPITRNFTLGSVAMEHFRSSILQTNTIGITPIKGYINGRNKSRKSNIWLDYIQQDIGKPILREQKIGKYYVDGYDPENRTIYEFFGCFFHGCNQESCNKNLDRSEKKPILNNKSLNEVLDLTKKRLEFFETKGYNIVSIWEHEYDESSRADLDLKQYSSRRFGYYKSIEKYGHINIRDAFFGGRTNNLFFDYECKDNEKIRYQDVTSLYPYVLVSNDYPIGHPEILTQFPNNRIDNYFGFIKCKMSAPKDLYIPVLPFRGKNNKLLFALCTICAENKTNRCTHTEKEREFVGTWFSEELKLALEKGYEIKKIYEVLHYSERSGELFKPYIQSWLKIKTESSGWPSSCETDEKRNQFIYDFNNREKVQLDSNKMVKNPGLRYISKLMLNSFWGKLGQRRNQSQTLICTDYYSFYNIISDAKYEVKGILQINEDIMIVNYVFSDDSYDRAGNTNIAIASMVTAYARMKLFSIIDRIESDFMGRVLHFDTDSVIFVDRPGLYLPPLGNFLGEMTDEIEKDHGKDSFIDKFASGGPKNYAYSVKTPNGPKFATKIKGINITSALTSILDFECVNDISVKYKNGDKQEILVEQLQFRTDQYHKVFTRIFNKKYRAVSEKRVITNDTDVIQTIPFGFIQ